MMPDADKAIDLMESRINELKAENEQLRHALLAWYEASDDEERKWAMELTVPLKEKLRT